MLIEPQRCFKECQWVERCSFNYPDEIPPCVKEENLNSAEKTQPKGETNKAMLKLLCDVEHAIRNGLSYSVTKESNLYKNIVEEISQHQHS